MLCLNSIITAGEPIEVEVSHTWVFNDQNAARDHSVKDAEVSVFANGLLVGPDYIPKEGDEIHISARSAKYGSAEATVTVPIAVPIEKIECRPTVINAYRYGDKPMNGYVDFNLHVALSIKDNAEIEDYFNMKFDYTGQVTDNKLIEGAWYEYTNYVSFSLGSFDEKAEPIFKEHIGAFESIMGSDDEIMSIFSDRQFAG